MIDEQTDIPVYELHMLPPLPPIFVEREPKRKVSPYAKFDKYHKKKRK